MSRFYSNPSREKRRDAMRAVFGWYEERAEGLDEIFDALVKNRTAQARNLGFQTYTDLRYLTRFGYGRREVESLRARLRETWLPCSPG